MPVRKSALKFLYTREARANWFDSEVDKTKGAPQAARGLEPGRSQRSAPRTAVASSPVSWFLILAFLASTSGVAFRSIMRLVLKAQAPGGACIAASDRVFLRCDWVGS